MKPTLRPAFHFTPPTHWMNDPNGLVYFDGEYHLFYQHHPHSMVWGPMHWGHAVSKDLIHWEHLPIALHPDEHGMIFSGSAVIDWHNTAGFGEQAMVAIFTYNKERIETQNLAYSTDRGRTWTKYAGNPVIPHPEHLKDIRDPKVFWHADHWVMLLAAGDCILFYTSTNLKDWQASGTFGNGYGSTSGVWETPDLFQLPLTASDSRWVLVVGVGAGAYAGGSGTQYFIGSFDGKGFTSHNPKETILWMDYGADFYAPQSWNEEPHGRRILLAWMNNWQYAREIPATTWRGAFTLPREISLTQTDAGIRLAQQPIAELKNLRTKTYHWENQIILPTENILENIELTNFEIIAEFQMTSTTQHCGFRVCTGDNEHTSIGYNNSQRQLVVDRTNAGESNFHEGFAKIQEIPAPLLESNVLKLHIFVDHHSIEVFANNGEISITNLIFPIQNNTRLELFTNTETKIKMLDIYEMI
jgi:fructan beta-fructosidase